MLLEGRTDGIDLEPLLLSSAERLKKLQHRIRSRILFRSVWDNRRHLEAFNALGAEDQSRLERHAQFLNDAFLTHWKAAAGYDGELATLLGTFKVGREFSPKSRPGGLTLTTLLRLPTDNST